MHSNLLQLIILFCKLSILKQIYYCILAEVKIIFKYISSALLNTGSRAFYFPMTIAVPTASNTIIQQKGCQQEMLWKHWKRADCSNETNEAFPLLHPSKSSASYKRCMLSILVHQYRHKLLYRGKSRRR